MNLGLCALLILMGMFTVDKTASFVWVSAGNLPALVYSIILTAKISMAGVDPSRELSALKYDYKGA